MASGLRRLQVQTVQTADSQVSYQHVHTEAWLEGYESSWNAVQKFQNAPKALTSMGYDGFVSSYFTKRELDTAYATEGLALDFWTAFDSTWNQPWWLGIAWEFDQTSIF